MTTRSSMTSRRTLALLAGALTLAPAADLAAQQYPTSPPPAAPVQPATFPPFQEVTLPNGVRMVLVENHRQPVVSISLSFPAGNAFEPKGKEGLADLVAGLLTKGAGKRTADQVSEAIEGVGGSIGATAGPDFLTLRADALSPHADLAMELLADAAVRPALPAEEVELLRTQTLSGLTLELSQPASLASRFFAGSLYGDHPYGRRPTPASVRSITRDDLVAFREARLRPRSALLVIAGDLTLARARALANKHFGSWTGAAAAPIVMATPPARTRSEILLVHRPGSVQSNIVAGNTTFRPGDPRYYASVVANRVLGGSADSRLFAILREQKGWTYGAYSQLQRPRGLGSFLASAEVRTEVTDSALAELLTQVRRIGSEPVTAGELEAARSSLVGSFPLTIETAEGVAAAVTTAKLLELPADYLRTYRTRLAAVTPAELTAAARATMRANELLVVVVGDATKTYDKLRQIGPVRIVSVEGTPISPAELNAPVSGATVDPTRIRAASDSFTINVQGSPMGFQTRVVEKTASGFRITEESRVGSMVQQSSEITLGPRGELLSVRQSSKQQGQDGRVEVTVANGKATGTVMTPGQAAGTPTTIDVALPAGALDDVSLQALLSAVDWQPTTKLTFNMLSVTERAVKPVTLAVAGTEKVTVPAGEFDTYRVEMTGGRVPVSFFVSRAAPHRVVKVSRAGQPIEFVLAK